MKRVSIKKICICVLILVALLVVIHFKSIYEYNQCVEKMSERYLYLSEDLNRLISNEEVSFQEINNEYAFFMTNYAEWESLYRTNYERNMLPQSHGEYNISIDTVADTYRDLRDLYYECVEKSYFNAEKLGEEEQLKLETLDDDFKILLEKTEYL